MLLLTVFILLCFVSDKLSEVVMVMLDWGFRFDFVPEFVEVDLTYLSIVEFLENLVCFFLSYEEAS